MKNTIRAALVAGLIGSATLGLAGAANAAVTPGQDWALGAPRSYSQHFNGHKSEDEDGGGSSDDGGSSEGPSDDGGASEGPAEDAANDPAPEAAPEEPAESPAEPAESPAEPAESPEEPAESPAEPAEVPSDSAPEQPAEAPSDSAPEQPESGPAADEPSAPEHPDTTDADPADDTSAPSQEDVNAAEDADPMEADPAPAQESEVEEMSELVEETMTSESTVSSGEWNREVTAWNSSWMRYDSANRPVFMNPYNSPMQLFYTYGNAPRIVTVPPLQSVAVNAPTSGVYPFTSVVRTPSGPIRQVSVGSFTGGGQKPVQPAALTNALVQLRYSTGSSAPFRVKTLTDLGDDSTMGAHRVMIDNRVTAWGQWSKGPGGEKEFVITKTQQLPGLGTPSEAPLPGYNVAITKR